jgi:steroid delta-isomerase-like uncharacterized protein
VSAENISVVRRCIEEMWNGREPDLADALYTADFVEHNPSNTDLGVGPESVRRLMRIYLAAFPDVRFTIDDIFAVEDKVVVRYTARGTQKGELMGIAATDQQVIVSGMAICRVSNGRVAESWINWDTFGMVQQLTRLLHTESRKLAS